MEFVKKHLKQILLSILLICMSYIFKEDLYKALHIMKETPTDAVFISMSIVVVYAYIESLIIRKFVNIEQNLITPWQSFKVLMCTQFAKIATLGSGSAVGFIYYLNEYKVSYACATSISLISFVVQKIAMGLMSFVFFLANYPYVCTNYLPYIKYIWGSFLLILIICLGCILVGTSRNVHALLLKFLRLLDFKHKHELKIEVVETRLEEFRGYFLLCFRKPKDIVYIMGGYTLKHLLMYAIPYVLLYKEALISFHDMLLIMALTTAIASVIPAPSGMGSTEFVFITLMELIGISNRSLLLSTILLYRFLTFIFPGILGIVFVVIRNFFGGNLKDSTE